MLEPNNEQGVIVAFQQVCSELGLEITSIQSKYPDAILYDHSNNTKIRAEFEYNANNFIVHKHDPMGADLVICWKRYNAKLCLPILELSTLVTHPPSLDYDTYVTKNKTKTVKRKTEDKTHKLQHRAILITESISFMEMTDGSSPYINIMISKNNGKVRTYGEESQSSENARKAIRHLIELARMIRDASGTYNNNTDEAKQLDTLTRKILLGE